MTDPIRERMEEIVAFRTTGHPEANGRAPLKGEQAWTLIFPLEDGRKLHVEVGKEDFQHFVKMLTQYVVDTEHEEQP